MSVFGKMHIFSLIEHKAIKILNSLRECGEPEMEFLPPRRDLQRSSLIGHKFKIINCLGLKICILTIHTKVKPLVKTSSRKINPIQWEFLRLTTISNLFHYNILKAGLSLSTKKNCFICFNENPLKTMANIFYFI